MNTITYHTWKVRQQIARLVLLCAIALVVLPTIAFGTTTAGDTGLVLLKAPSIAALSPPLSGTSDQPPTLSRLSALIQ